MNIKSRARLYNKNFYCITIKLTIRHGFDGIVWLQGFVQQPPDKGACLSPASQEEIFLDRLKQSSRINYVSWRKKIPKSLNLNYSPYLFFIVVQAYNVNQNNGFVNAKEQNSRNVAHNNIFQDFVLITFKLCLSIYIYKMCFKIKLKVFKLSRNSFQHGYHLYVCLTKVSRIMKAIHHQYEGNRKIITAPLIQLLE